MYGYNDLVPVFNEMEGNKFQPQKIDFSKEESDIFVGRKFKDKAQFKLTMSIYALAKVCRFKFRHCKRYITAKCVDKQLQKYGTSRVLAALLRSKYERLHCGPRAMELPEVLRTEFNYTCTYWKAWKAKELAIVSAQGIEEMSYKMLPQYLHVLKLANPGTITDIKTELDRKGKLRFLYAFMLLKACIDGWQHLRKVLVVDGTHMFEKYKGVLLSASGQDADYRVFPISFAVVDSENSDSWKWFFERLSTIGEDSCELTIISDRCAAIFVAKDK
ncbi:uncharacterized protein LOC103873674 [Brassica rapa]|uniref:uncharacterized protein LOC103873674 n=1 Tax=Brassica campestris TaxID=3711 RepID=UPI0004F1A072|nr:uncharacterized protein LOC103873674 [Brassica rapa]